MIQSDIIRLIVIEESANDAEVILNSLRKARFPIRPRHVEDDEDLEEALDGQLDWDLLISVPQVGEFTVENACQMVKRAKQDIPIIVLFEVEDNTLQNLDDSRIAGILSTGAKQVIPYNDGCLQAAVSHELQSLAERRKLKKLEQLYKESQKHNKMLLETSRDAIAYVHDGMHIHLNPSYLEMFGYKELDDLEGLPIMDLVALEHQAKFKEFMREFMMDNSDDDRQIDLLGVKGDKKHFKLKMEVSHAIYDSEECIQVIIRDQSQNEEMALKLKEANRREQLTGLYNRQYFSTLLEKSLARAIEKNIRSILFYVALDNFSSATGSVGVGSRDPVIKNVAQALHQATNNQTLARFSDSVFTFIVVDMDIKTASALAEKLCKTIAELVTEIDEESVFVTASIGLALVLSSASSPEDILTDAHTACLMASKKGGNTHEVYKAVISKDSHGEEKMADIAKMIETAIEEDRLFLHYQPIVSLHDETDEIYEVFLRMVDSEGHNIPAGELFSAAEKANLTTHLDKWVLKEAVKVLMRQQQEGHKTYFFIKLSDQAVRDENILLYIRKLLKSTQLTGAQLVFEINESVAISHTKPTRAFIMGLKAIGCKTALEHFGTSLNRQSMLKHVPVDYIKIESSFTKDLSNHDENQKTVKEIVEMAHEEGKITIAEAVEDANSLTILWTSGVDLAQGHYIQEPSDDLSYDFTDEE